MADAHPACASLQVSPELNVGKCEKFCDFKNKHSKTGIVKWQITLRYQTFILFFIFVFKMKVRRGLTRLPSLVSVHWRCGSDSSSLLGADQLV